MIVLDNKGEQWISPVDEIHGILPRVHPGQFPECARTVSKGKAHFYPKAYFPVGKKGMWGFLDDERPAFTLTRSLSDGRAISTIISPGSLHGWIFQDQRWKPHVAILYENLLGP